MQTGGGYSLYVADGEILDELAKFVVTENYQHHLNSDSEVPEPEIEYAYTEEKRLLHISRILVAATKRGKS